MKNPVSIHPKLLIGIYASILLMFAVYFADTVFELGINDTLPRSPQNIFLFHLVFGTPHIVASNLMLVSNADYFKTYWKKMLLATVGIILFFAVAGSLLSFNMIYIIVSVTTLFHVFRQQFGLAKSFTNGINRRIQLMFEVSAIFVGVYVYNMIFEKWDPAFYALLTNASYVGLFLIALASLYFLTRKEIFFGKLFYLMNICMIFSCYFFYSQSYYFFAILTPRIIHDVTAYVFYISHDMNRIRQEKQSILYRLSKYQYLPLVLVPAVSIFISFMLGQFGDQVFNTLSENVFDKTFPKAISLGFVGYLGLMHYFTESFVWKRTGEPRKFISIKKPA